MRYFKNLFMWSLVIIVPILQSDATETPTEEALFLTPYIERGDIDAGKQASLTQSLIDYDTNNNTVSYSGLFTVNKTYNSNLFFWFFPAEQNSKTAPLIIWLHGILGQSSVYGVFELGPYILNKEENLMKRNEYLSKKFNVLFLDNLVGIGFSFTEHNDGYSRNQSDIGKSLYNAVVQFYKLFPEFKKNDLYIAGISYAGKFVPSLAYHIDINQSDNINLKGMIIGNGFSEPLTILKRHEVLYKNGLISRATSERLKQYYDRMVYVLGQGRLYYASAVIQVINDVSKDVSGHTNFYNFLNDSYNYPYGNIVNFVNSTKIRNRLHVGNLTFNDTLKVNEYLEYELFESVKPLVEHLLEKYKFLMYHGLLDMEVPYVLHSEYIQSLNWSGAEDYKNAERKLWRLDNSLVGYTQTGGRLKEAAVRNAGHNAHVNKPIEILGMISDFIAHFIPLY